MVVVVGYVVSCGTTATSLDRLACFHQEDTAQAVSARSSRSFARRQGKPVWSPEREAHKFPNCQKGKQTHNLKLTHTFQPKMTIVSNSPLVFKYLKLLPFGARGGVTRFFMLAQGIPFEERLFGTADEWPAEKKRLIESGENPAGTLPILESNGESHPQHIAVSRYLARVHQVTSGDDYKDYVQDLVADEYQSFRNHWVKVTFSGTDSEKEAYQTTDVPNYLTKFDALYDKFKTEAVFLSTSGKTGQPLWGDAAIFGLLRDHILSKYITKDDLAAYPRLNEMYNAYESIPAVAHWLAQLN